MKQILSEYIIKLKPVKSKTAKKKAKPNKTHFYTLKCTLTWILSEF